MLLKTNIVGTYAAGVIIAGCYKQMFLFIQPSWPFLDVILGLTENLLIKHQANTEDIIEKLYGESSVLEDYPNSQDPQVKSAYTYVDLSIHVSFSMCVILAHLGISAWRMCNPAVELGSY